MATPFQTGPALYSAKTAACHTSGRRMAETAGEGGSTLLPNAWHHLQGVATAFGAGSEASGKGNTPDGSAAGPSGVQISAVPSDAATSAPTGSPAAHAGCGVSIVSCISSQTMAGSIDQRRWFRRVRIRGGAGPADQGQPGRSDGLRPPHQVSCRSTPIRRFRDCRCRNTCRRR